MRLIIALALLAATAAAPVAAQADRMTVAIPTADLNLASAAGQRALAGRIHRAARTICETGLRGVRARGVEAECMADIRAQADAQLTDHSTIAVTRPRPRG